MPDLESRTFGPLTSRSPKMKQAFTTLERAAPFPATILLLGESGTGKREAAQTVWKQSKRGSEAWVAFDCSSVPESLLESRLFGHVAGAFTDAIEDRAGVFEQADGATLFISELASASASVQVRFLRVLQEGVVQRLGENRDRPVDVRLLVSAPEDLRERVESGRFRKDLYYRLNVIEATIPPLRERLIDVPMLVEEFAADFHEQSGVELLPFSDEAVNVLQRYSWPGNVRELRNVVQRSLVLADGPSIEPEDLPDHLTNTSHSGPVPIVLDDDNLSIKHWSRELEKHLIQRALEETDGNRTHAARRLEISHRTLLYKLKDYFPDGLD